MDARDFRHLGQPLSFCGATQNLTVVPEVYYLNESVVAHPNPNLSVLFVGRCPLVACDDVSYQGLFSVGISIVVWGYPYYVPIHIIYYLYSTMIRKVTLRCRLWGTGGLALAILLGTISVVAP